MEAKENKRIDIHSNIKQLRLIDCIIADFVPSSFAGKFDKGKVQFEFRIDVKTDIVKNTINIGLHISIYADEGKLINLGHLTSEGEFDVLNLEEVLSVFENKIPTILLANFFGVVIGTSRGFLIDRTQGTIMEGVYIPIVNPINLIPQESN